MAGAVSDTFDNLDAWWESGDAMTLSGGRLQLSPTGVAWEEASATQTGSLEGDFVLEFEWSADTVPTTNMWDVGLLLHATGDVLIKRMDEFGDDYIMSVIDSTPEYVVSTNNNGKFKVARVGDTFTTYYHDGSDWVQIQSATHSGFGDPTYIKLYANREDAGDTLVASFDNLVISQETNDIDVILSAPLPWEDTTQFYDVLLGSFTAAVIPDLRGTLRKYDIDVPLASVIPGITGLTEKFLTIAGTLAAVVPSLEGTAEQIGTISIPLAAVRPKLTGQTERLATLDAVVCSVIPDLSGLVHGFGTISATLATVVPEIISLGTFHIICCNMAGGVTEYSNYNFNSFFEHDGKVYGVTNAGVYLLEGATDAGTAISAYATGGKGNMGVLTQKTVTDVFTHTNVNGNLSLNLKADDATTGQTYTLTGDGSLKNRRWKCALGVQGQEWQWQITNASGSDFEIRRLEFLADIASRR